MMSLHTHLTKVFTAIGVTDANDAFIIRRLLMATRDMYAPLYIVVTNYNSSFVVSNYMAATRYIDLFGHRVFAVWRDDACMWHVVEQ